MEYLGIFIFAAILSALLTIIVRKIALRWGIVDQPDLGQPGSRKIHVRTIPLLGGVAVFVAYFGLLFFYSDRFLAGSLEWPHLVGFSVGALILVIGGALDDKYNLKPRRQIIFPLLAIAAIILGGVEIARLTNPWNGFFDLQPLIVVSPILIAVWLLGMMYTTKLLDGVDGLVSGIGAIGGFIIFLFTLTTRFYQPDIALAALLLAGTAAGFLIFNWHPAKIFLGEGGSLLFGYILGVLAIISGSKIATALLIMGIPILDVVWTILRRLRQGKNPLRFADQRHLHHRLLSLGLNQRQTSLVFYILAAAFGLGGLFLQSRGKLSLLALLVLVMLVIVVLFERLDRRAKVLILVLAVSISVALPTRAAEPDFDGDGYSDSEEIAAGYSPFNPEPVRAELSDMDEDGLTDSWELKFGTDAFRADTDGDGYGDFFEIDQAFDPLFPDKRLEQKITVDRSKQQMSYEVGGQVWKEWTVSTGKPSMPTPAGEYKIVNKALKPWSRAYGLWMPYWLGLGGNGLRNGLIGIHELPVWPGGYREGEDHLGKAVSHGCIRLGMGPSKYLYERAEVGTLVIIK